MEFKDCLKKLREEKGITQEALANEIHISRSAVAKWEAGLGLPSEASIIELCEYFSVDRRALLADVQTESMLVEKNVEIRRHKLGISFLLILLFTVISCFSIWSFCDYQKKVQKEKELLIISTPTAHNIFFDNPFTMAEPKVPMEGKNYVLLADKYTQVYFEVDINKKLCEEWYAFYPSFQDCETVYLQEVSRRAIGEEEGECWRIMYSVYVRPQNIQLRRLTLSEFKFSHKVDGVLYEKACEIETRGIAVVVW